MDECEFARRIKVYLEVDSPEISNSPEVAGRLAARLWQYVVRERTEPPRPSQTLASLLPAGRMLFLFTAAWDGSVPGYRETVDEVAQRLGAAVIVVDVDDLIGSTIARLHGVANAPSIADARSSRPPIVGARTADELAAALDAQ